MSAANQQYGSSGYNKNASSSEEGEHDDRTIASQMLIRKIRKQLLDKLGVSEGRERIDILSLNTLLDVKLLLEDEVKHRRMSTPLGIVKTITLNLVGGNALTHIDFEQSENTSGVPANNVVNEPQAKLFQIHVYNDGPGQIAYGLNNTKSQFEAQVGLLNGENKGFTFTEPTIKTLNILSTSGNAKARIITLI